MTLESYQPGSYTNALYGGDFPALADDEEVSRMVELYRRDAGSRLPPGESPPAAALTPTPPPPTEPVADPEIYPTPILEEPEYGGGGDTDFGGRGSRVKPAAAPTEPYPEGDWKANAPPPPNGGRWIGEEITHTPAPAEAEDPSTWQEIKGGVARGATGVGKHLGHVAGYVSKKLGNMTDSDILKQFGDSIDGFVDGLDQQAQGIVPPRTMGEAWDKGYGTFANWTLGKTLEGGVGMLPPLVIARYAGIPAVLAYGAATFAVEEARREGSTNESILAAAGNGAVQMGLPLKVMKMTEGQALLKRIATQAAAFAGIGAAAPFAEAGVGAAAGEGYKVPEAGQVGEGAYLGGVLGAAMAPTTPGPRAVARRTAAGYEREAARSKAAGEEYGPNQPYGPELPPRPYPPREPPPGEQYGPELPPRPYPPREPPPEQYGPELPPRPYPPRPEGEGPKGSPETAPPTASGDPAATAAIDAAVNPPRPTEPVTPTAAGEGFTVGPGTPVGEARIMSAATPAEQRQFRPTEEAAPSAGAVRPETTTDVIKPTAPDALKAAEAAGYKLEADHLDPNRQVAKNPAGEVIGKGGTPEETIADAVRRNGAPYVDEAAPTRARPTGERVELPPIPEEVLAAARPRPRPTEEFTPETRAKATRGWDEFAREDAAGDQYNPPVTSNRARDAYNKAWEEAAGDTAWAARRGEAPAAPAEAPVARAQPGLRRKIQPVAAEEAIATSKAQAETPAAAPQAAAAASGQPTTVVKRPTKRVEVQVGKRGEAAVGEESTAQRETADAAEAAQQRRLAERRAEKLPPRAQEARRTSLMADEIAATERRRGSGQERSTMEATGRAASRGTPIEEISEGSATRGQATEGGIAETRSQTTTDKNLKYNDLLHDVIQQNKTLDEASQAAGSKAPGTRGRPRKNADLATYLEKEVIPRAEKANRADAAYMRRVTPILENRARTTAQRDKLLERVYESIQKRAKGRGRSEQERESLEDIKRWRDELRGVEKKGGAAEVESWADPMVKASNKANRRLLDLTVNKKLQERMERSDKDRTLDSVHDYLNDIINDPGAKIASPDMVELARHLKRILPDDVMAGSYRTLAEDIGMPGLATRGDRSLGTYIGEHIDSIGFKPEGSRGQSHLETVTHEATHGVVFKYLDHIFQKVKRGDPLTEREQKHKDALDAIHKETTRLRDEHAISDEEYNALDYAVRASMGNNVAGSERIVGGRHELVTQIMNSPYVRSVMARTEVSPEFKAAMKDLGYKEPQNLWQAFKMFVKDIVGFKKESVLDRVLDPMTDILETGGEYRRAEAMGLEFADSPILGGRRWRKGDVPTDGLPNQWARDMMRPFGEAVADSRLFSREGVKERYEGFKPTAARWGSKTAEFVSPTYKMAEFNEDVLPAGRKIMDAAARTNRVADDYYNKWGDRVQNWTRQLRYGRDVASLMNDATLAKTYVTDQPGLFTQRNAHLSADEMLVAEKLQDRYAQLTPEKQKLYSDVRDYYRQTHEEQRKLEYEHVVKEFLPEATQAQTEALANQLSTRRGIREMIDNPQSVSPEAAALSAAFGERWENSRVLVKEIAKLQDTGFVEGDYFPLRRYGDYVVRYGEQGTKHYGVEMFESSNEAATRRTELERDFAELAKTDPTAKDIHISDVLSKRANTFTRREMMPESAFADMERALVNRGATKEQIEQAKDAYAHARMRREVMSAQSQSRMRRTGVEGASADAARNLHNHFMSTGRTFGHLKEGANTTEAFREARQQASALEKATGTPGTAADIARSKSQLDALETRFANKDPAVSKADLDHARQQHQWLEKPPSSQEAIRARTTLEEFEARRAPIGGDDSSTFTGKAAGQFTKASFVYHLARPAHLALQVAGSHAEAQSFLGAHYGQRQAAGALARAMRDLTPTSLSRGFRNGLKAFQGEMKYSDWNMREVMLNRLIKLKPGDKAHEQEMRDLDNAAADYGLVDHTQTREIQQMSRPGAFEFGNPTRGKWTNLPANMMNLFAVGTHTVDASMRMTILKAGYDLARNSGADPAAARQSAIKYAMDSMPVYGSWNTPRVASASHSPHFKELTPAVMQYKQYGLHMYANMASLVRNAMFRPAERAEALKALAGLFATHSVIGGVTGSLMALPVVAALGAWDLFQGAEKPHDYETDLKRAITDMGGETAGTFASGGLFGLAGANQARSFKLSNMVDVPYLRSFDKAGAGQWIMQAMTGASGDVATQIFDGLHELTSGNPGRAAKLMLPRVFSDPIKAYQLGTEGVVDKRGRTITPASQVTLGQQAFQATGFTPYAPSLARQRRHAEEEYQGEYQYARKKAIDRYVLSGGKDMSAVRSYMNNKDFREVSPIKFSQLREAMKAERQREARPEFYGARPTKREQRPFREATRFN